jgi:hypothetical protein
MTHQNRPGKQFKLDRYFLSFSFLLTTDLYIGLRIVPSKFSVETVRDTALTKHVPFGKMVLKDDENFADLNFV